MTGGRAEIAERLRTVLKGRVAANFSLAPFTTYRLGGPAAIYVEPSSVDDVTALGRFLRAEQAIADLPLLALGRGSNVVVSDEGWPGIVIRLAPDGFSWIRPRAETTLSAGASTPLPQLANWSARRGLSGLEFLIAIPGSVGGAVRMNAGAHGAEIGNSLLEATVFTLDGAELRTCARADLDLSYRHSNLTESDLVLEATFEVEPETEDSVRARVEAYRRHRAETQPGAASNAGSVFKNPSGDHAGRMVEAAGLKGFRVGGAEVSSLHANFFVAGPGATAQDVYDLVAEVQRRVREETGIELAPEVRFAGRFRAAERGSLPA